MNNRSSPPNTFPYKLHFMLRSICDSSETVFEKQPVTWLPCGSGFKVLDANVFLNDIIPLYFSKQTQMRSFTRQLNLWGFTRWVFVCYHYHISCDIISYWQFDFCVIELHLASIVEVGATLTSSVTTHLSYHLFNVLQWREGLKWIILPKWPMAQSSRQRRYQCKYKRNHPFRL